MPTLVLLTFKNITLSVIFGKGKIQWIFSLTMVENLYQKIKTQYWLSGLLCVWLGGVSLPLFFLYFSLNCRFNLRKRAASDWSLTALIQMIVTLESWHWHWKMFNSTIQHSSTQKRRDELKSIKCPDAYAMLTYFIFPVAKCKLTFSAIPIPSMYIVRIKI